MIVLLFCIFIQTKLNYNYFLLSFSTLFFKLKSKHIYKITLILDKRNNKQLNIKQRTLTHKHV